MEKTVVINAKKKWFDFNLKELWEYRELVFLFFKRNYSTRYKQTILGPAWLIISPIFTVFAYTIVFGGIAGLSTDGVPRPMFYLAGSVLWNFFNGCVTEISNTFSDNAGLFGKIYFPRLVNPLSTILTRLADFFIQMGLLIVIYFYYLYNGYNVKINIFILLCPIVLLQFSMLALGIGIIVSSITTKYKDLKVLVGFGMQIWLYASPVMYSVTLIPKKFYALYLLNPITPGLLIFKKALFGIGKIPYFNWGISWIVTLFVMVIGVMIFNRVEKTFMDTI